MLHRAVDVNFVETGFELRPQLVPQIPHADHFLRHLALCDSTGVAQTHDAGHVQSPRAHASFVSAAIHLRGDLHTRILAPHIQSAHTLGAIEFVRGDRHDVDVIGIHVDRHFADRLHAIGVEQNAALAADLADLRHRLNHADFVVGVHDGDQNRFVRNGLAQHVQIDQAVAFERQIRNPVAVLLKLLAGVEHRFMFRRRGDDVIALFGIHLGHAFDGEVVGFGGAAGEDDFARRGADEVCNLLAGFIDRLFGHPAELMIAAGGVAEVFGEVRQHRVENAGVHTRRRVIVEINGRLHFVSLKAITYKA